MAGAHPKKVKELYQRAPAYRSSVQSACGAPGRQTSEGFPWSHYAAYQWTDDGARETLVVLFGTRAIEIEGHNLGVLVAEIREGQLNGIGN